ncbi:DUF692 domain-containing protein [Planctobacterium marinum]|uniref:DUF692 domain-containing protein n=1 Tax=Planctobacterium marinum TaxID=1631968 RepID=UPI001E531D34|nr:DUF692 domain-containing protein [Planctobacterium marinum]MCC2606519.1 DUF692 domain-containing protein [Planctobacterium marinum]
MFVENLAKPPVAGQPAVGVGLRFEHYQDVLQQASLSVDFLEIHAENFFAESPAITEFLEQVIAKTPLSIHGTSMGLGSAAGVDGQYLKKFANLVNKVNPIYVSEHACFTWGRINNSLVHAGDLLPLRFDKSTLQTLVSNIDRVQQILGRQILIENIVSYHRFKHQEYSEAEFLTQVAEQSGCGLLLDLNNILINLHNHDSGNLAEKARNWLDIIPQNSVGEIHLAGASPVLQGNLLIDDHSQPVSAQCWELFQYANYRFPQAAVLVEWDNDIPQWGVLLGEANKARRIIDNLVEVEAI